VICSDKTGTLTKNEMTVTKVATNSRQVSISGAGYAPEGEFTENDSTIDPTSDENLELLLRIGALNNDAHVQQNNGAWVCFGDPTEGALLVAAMKAGMDVSQLNESYSRVAELPFDSARKRMTTIHRTPEGELVAYVKGAPEMIMERSNGLLVGDSVRTVTEEDLKKNREQMDTMAAEALRVLAMSYKRLPDDYDLRA